MQDYPKIKEIKKIIECYTNASKLLEEHIKKTGLMQGAIDCPKCNVGTLRYSKASVNGHIHARCSTPKCLSWME